MPGTGKFGHGCRGEGDGKLPADLASPRLANGNPGLRRAEPTRGVGGVLASQPGAARHPGGRRLPMCQAMTLTFSA